MVVKGGVGKGNIYGDAGHRYLQGVKSFINTFRLQYLDICFIHWSVQNAKLRFNCNIIKYKMMYSNLVISRNSLNEFLTVIYCIFSLKQII